MVHVTQISQRTEATSSFSFNTEEREVEDGGAKTINHWRLLKLYK